MQSSSSSRCLQELSMGRRPSSPWSKFLIITLEYFYFLISNIFKCFFYIFIFNLSMFSIIFVFCIFEHDPRLHSNIVENLRLKRIIAVWILIFISVCNLYIRPDLTTMFEAFRRWRKVGQKDIPSLGDMIHWRYEICWRHFFKYGRGLKLKIQSDDLSGPLWDPRHHFHVIWWIYQSLLMVAAEKATNLFKYWPI